LPPKTHTHRRDTIEEELAFLEERLEIAYDELKAAELTRDDDRWRLYRRSLEPKDYMAKVVVWLTLDVENNRLMVEHLWRQGRHPFE